METTADILRKEGEQRGEQRGELKKTRDLLLRNINARFGTINHDLVEQINAIQSVEILVTPCLWILRAMSPKSSRSIFPM